MTAAKLQEVLGIDLAGDRLHVVQVEGVGGAVLTHWASADAPPDAGADELGSILHQLLHEGGFTARQAVIGLPPAQGFFQQDGGPDPQALGELNYVTDTFRAADGTEVRGVAPQAEISRALQAAAEAGVEPLAVELRSMGYLTALGQLDPTPDETGEQPDVILGLVLAGRRAFAALSRAGAPVAVHTRARRQTESVPDEAERLVRLIRMGQPDAVQPSEIRVIANAADLSALQWLADRLQISVRATQPGISADLGVIGEGPDDLAEYAGAIGLALEGLPGALPRAAWRRERRRDGSESAGLDFLHPARHRHRAPLPVKSIAVVAVVLVLGALAAAGVVSVQRHRRLDEARQRVAELREQISHRRDAIDRWELIGQWLPPRAGGTRFASRQVLDAVSELFPSTDSAYVTRFTLNWTQDGKRVTGKVEGRATDSEALYEFASRLNESEFFERAGVGTVAETSDERGFSKRFTVSFYLREAG